MPPAENIVSFRFPELLNTVMLQNEIFSPPFRLNAVFNYSILPKFRTTIKNWYSTTN